MLNTLLIVKNQVNPSYRNNKWEEGPYNRDSPSILELNTYLLLVPFSSVQFKVVSRRSEKPIIMRSMPSLRSFANVAFETVPKIEIWYLFINVSYYPPFRPTPRNENTAI